MTFYTGKKVLIAGGAGFLGSYMSERLIEQGAKVTILDNFETGLRSNIPEGATSILGDMIHLHKCIQAAKGQDVVINLAGRTHGVGYSSTHQGEMLFHNSTVQLNLLEAARSQGVERYLQVSSSCVYPDDAPMPTKEGDTNGTPEADNYGYGYAKWIAELQAQAYHEQYGMNISIVRPFNPYGSKYIPREVQNAHVIPALVAKVLRGDNPVEVWGSGNQTRNFLHAIDTVNLMLKICENVTDAVPVNIGYEQNISIRNLIQMIIRLAEVKTSIVYDITKPEGRMHKSADSKRLQRVSQEYEPQITLQEGLLEIIECHRASV